MSLVKQLSHALIRDGVCGGVIISSDLHRFHMWTWWEKGGVLTPLPSPNLFWSMEAFLP